MDDLRTTGVPALDTFLNGGLPTGFTSLMLAPSGAGAEIFAKQYSTGATGEKVVYFTTDESAREVQKTMRESGWNPDQLKIIDLQSQFADAMLEAQEQGQDVKSAPEPPGKKRSFDPRDLIEGTSSMDLLRRKEPQPSKLQQEPAGEDYLAMLLGPFAALRTPDRVVIHSLDFFLNMYPLDRVIATLTALKAANARNGGQMLWVLSKGAHGGTVERRLELLADCLLELEMTRKGTSFERFFMVKKVKNRSSGIGVSTYEIDRTGFQLETLERIV